MQRARPASRITLLTAGSSLSRLRAAGRLVANDGVVALSLGETPGRGKFAIAWMTLRALGAIVARRFDVVHICLPSPIYAPLAVVLSRLPKSWRPRVALTVIDCTLAYSVEAEPPANTYEHQVLDAHRIYARWARLDAIYSWYRLFLDAAQRHPASAGAPLMRAARYCFTDPARFTPGRKENLVVFAGRLSDQKRPMLFLDAVAELRRRHPDLVAGWRFEMYGKGIHEAHVAQRIAELGIGDQLMLTHSADMAPVFARSTIFVSTQAFENFTSLSMLEAMAAGNIIVAEDVGQTREFVRPGENGYLVAPATADAFATALATCLRSRDDHAHMAQASRAIATDVHTIEHFADDITAFWADVARA